ncbi:Ribosomal RNA small subunit methyltransferase NEP1 [Glycine soja]
MLFEVKPHVRIPRTCNRFCGVIIELLKKSSVWAKAIVFFLGTYNTPFSCQLSHSLSYTSEKLVDIEEYVSVWTNDLSPVFVVGTLVNRKVKGDYMHDYISGLITENVFLFFYLKNIKNQLVDGIFITLLGI